jgi:hypothetical protein
MHRQIHLQNPTIDQQFAFFLHARCLPQRPRHHHASIATVIEGMHVGRKTELELKIGVCVCVALQPLLAA